MNHSLGDVDLSAIIYQDRPIFSPDSFQQLDREDFLRDADGIIEPDPSSFQFPAVTQTPNPKPSMDYSFSSDEPIDFEQFDVEDLLGHEDDDPNTATPMEIAHLEKEVAPLQVNGHQGPNPAGDIGMGKAPGELNVKSLETDGTGLKETTAEPCSGHIDLSTVTDSEIIDHFRALVEHREDNKQQEVPKFDDDLVRLEPWKLSVCQQAYRATHMVSSDEKTIEGGCWKEEEFMGIHRLGPYSYGKEMPLMGLRRALEFHKADGTKTEWRMLECIWVRFSDGHMFLEDDGDSVQRYVSRDVSLREFFNSIINSISGEGDEDNLNKGTTLHSDCLHHHPTVQNNQTPSPWGKRPRTNGDSKKTKLNVWQHFTRIYIKVSNKEVGSKNKNRKDGKKLVYAVCNYCDKVFKADSKQGTSHHGRHAESCLRKHSHPSSSKSCSQDVPLIHEAREIVPTGGCGNGMLCV